jgi:endonuclease-3
MKKKNSAIHPLLEQLKSMYPHAACALHHTSPYELLIATILSAQCTDKRVNMVTPALFKRYPTPFELAHATPSDVENIIRSTGFFRAKTASIIGTAKNLVAHFQGQVPNTLENLITLPGVARKTANVVMGVAFNTPSGVVVDTHVKRISQRLGLTQHTSPEKIEQDLTTLLPKKEWIGFSHLLIEHGRTLCTARNPQCAACPLQNTCKHHRMAERNTSSSRSKKST